jgi:hypothetical protein
VRLETTEEGEADDDRRIDGDHGSKQTAMKLLLKRSCRIQNCQLADESLALSMRIRNDWPRVAGMLNYCGRMINDEEKVCVQLVATTATS